MNDSVERVGESIDLTWPSMELVLRKMHVAENEAIVLAGPAQKESVAEWSERFLGQIIHVPRHFFQNGDTWCVISTSDNTFGRPRLVWTHGVYI